mgnify:CR=1 FL=1
MMILEYIQEGAMFLAANAASVALIMSIVQYVKLQVNALPWYKGEYMTALGFLLGFMFAIPVGGFVGIDWVAFVIHGVALGGAATGIFKIGDELISRA